MIKSTKNGLFTYTRTLLENPDNFVVYEMGGVFYMAAVSSAVRVYNAKTFNLIFEGPSFRRKTKQILHRDNRLYVTSDNIIYVVNRGETESAHKIVYDGVGYTVSLIQGNEVYKNEYAGLVIECMLFVGPFVVLAMSTNAVIVMDHFSILYVIEGDVRNEKDANRIRCIMHPATYINKVLIVYDNKMQIYNVVSRKVIYTFNICNVRQAVQTPLIDVVALLRETDIVFFNLRQNKEMFIIRVSRVRHVSFRTDTEPYMICCNENTYIFELSRLKCVAELKDIHWACFLPGQKDLISAGQNLEFYSMEGYKPILVHRRVLHSKIECMDIISTKHMVLMEENSVIGINIYKDDLTFRFSCKDMRNINKIRVDKEEVVVSGYSNIFLLDFDKKNGRLVNTSSDFEFEHLGFEHPFCAYGRKELKVFNVVSRRVVSRIGMIRCAYMQNCNKQSREEANIAVSCLCILDIAIIQQKIYVAVLEKVLVLSFEGNMLGEIDVAGGKKMKRYGNMLFINTDKKVVMVDVNSLKLVRKFEYQAIDYFVTKDLRMVGILTPELLLIDIASGNVLDRVQFEKTPRSALFSVNHDFLFVLFNDGTVCTYYNNAMLNDYLAQPASLPAQNIEFRKCDDQNYLIEIFDKDFFRAQKVLGEVGIDKKDYKQIEKFIDFYSKKWEEVEEMCLETIGIVEFHKRVRELV
eukprot:jgi/Antlo1/1577/2010